MIKVKLDFFFELYEKGSIPKIFQEVYSSVDKKAIPNNVYDEQQIAKTPRVYSVFFIPDYLRPRLDHNVFNVKKLSQFFKGYSVQLHGFSDVDTYLKHRFKNNAKSIRKRVRRLESCFQISDKMYYGAITEKEYDFFMDSLYDMLVRRFEQRNDVSQSLLNWGRFRKMYFNLINEKRASLFVVQEGDKPIIISLNHHFQGKLFSAISSYDIDYSKFSLGSVEIYKKLDWCIENGHNSYEMGMGDLSYKREWCNHIYNFEHQIIFPKQNLNAGFVASLEYVKASLKELIFKIAYVRYKKYKASRKKSKNIGLNYEAFPERELQGENYPVIDINTETHAFLRKPVYDFQYSNIENSANILILEISKEEKSYLIKGTNKIQKVVFGSNVDQTD